MRLSKAFASFEERPMAEASLRQVRRAEILAAVMLMRVPAAFTLLWIPGPRDDQLPRGGDRRRRSRFQHHRARPVAAMARSAREFAELSGYEV